MMTDIIDIHAHILPGVDDGAVDWDESRAMLKIAYEHGIRTIIATPHFSRRLDVGMLRELAVQLADEAMAIDPAFHIFLGQEIMYFDSLVEYLNSGAALTLAGSRCVLIEFMPTVSYQNIYQWMRTIILSGYIPVIAHVERYRSLRTGNRLQELIDSGCYLQMNYQSLEGGLFDVNSRWCRKMILNDSVHFLSTDMHHCEHRAPMLSKSLKWLDKNLNGEHVLAMTQSHARQLLLNQLLV